MKDAYSDNELKATASKKGKNGKKVRKSAAELYALDDTNTSRSEDNLQFDQSVRGAKRGETSQCQVNSQPEAAGLANPENMMGDDKIKTSAEMEQDALAISPIPIAQPPLLRAVEVARGSAARAAPGAYRGGERIATPDFGILAASAADASIAPIPSRASIAADAISDPIQSTGTAHTDILSDPGRGANDRHGGLAGGLVEAYAIEEGDGATDLERADPIDPEAVGKQRQRQIHQEKRQRNSYTARILWILLVTAIIILIVVGCVVGTKKSNNNPDLVVFPSTAASPTVYTSPQSRSNAPSSAPSGALDSLLDTLPTRSVARINSGSETPQWKAWNWLASHENVTFLPEWRKTQLFALATFFYSFEGENWHKPVHDKWMDETKEECFWFSQGFGYFWDETYQEWEPEFQVQPCNFRGEFTTLWLSQLHLSGFSPSIPPEIALLTSLSNLGFGTGNIEMPMSEMLPLDFLHEMTSLTELWLDTNQLTGPIPSQLGELTALTELWLNSNSLSGTLPSELGELSALVEFRLSDNLVMGQIPSELGRMMNLTDVRLNNLQLTGTLPSELGLLTSLSLLDLRGNSLTGTIPTELKASMGLALYGNHFTGIVPDHLCSSLHCDCAAEVTLVSTCDDVVQSPPQWPGRFPTKSDAVMLNILTDGFPEQTSWIWQRKSSSTGVWVTLESRGPLAFPHYLYSAVLPVSPKTTYRVVVFDSRNGGFMGNGYITLTGANESVLHSSGDEAFSEIIIEVSLESNESFSISNSTLR